MDIQKIIKILKSVEADAAYTARSRHTIMGMRRGAPRLTVFSYIGTMLAEGSAIALAGALLLLIMTGFSTWEFLSPFELKSLDPAGLRAEAHAIDIQVQLTLLAYPDVLRNQSTTAPRAISTQETTQETAIKAEAQEQAHELGLNAETSSKEKTTTTINDALDRLAE